ncbi:DUF1622 domain-containing protein [Saccharopolyspora shandongensis]|uniref:DUF1622 domain-containing protein n=1 Tax=Saccharopolyspora shandongensis TaxID=418495 RepID=UPI0033E8F591
MNLQDVVFAHGRMSAHAEWLRAFALAGSCGDRTFRGRIRLAAYATAVLGVRQRWLGGRGGMVEFQHVADLVGKGVDAVGVATIVVGALAAITVEGVRLARRQKGVYRSFRRRLGQSILLGLEFLVAGDIIRTVAVSPTFASLGVLAVIVAIRTFLSFSLELEITGRWPWQKTAEAATGTRE